MADVILRVTIPDAKVAKVRDGFLKMRPIPQTAGVDNYTVKRWVELCAADYIQRVATAGLKQIQADATNDDVTLITG